MAPALLRASEVYPEDALRRKREMYHDILRLCYQHIDHRKAVGNDCVFYLPVFAPSTGVMYNYRHVQAYLAKKLRLGGFSVVQVGESALYVQWPDKAAVQHQRHAAGEAAQASPQPSKRPAGRRQAPRRRGSAGDEIVLSL